MAESLEYQTLVRCRSKLVTGLQLDPANVADELISRRLIPPSVGSEMSDQTKSNDVKARRLVDCVFTKVEISSDSYHNFIDAFTECGWLDDLIGILNTAHRELSSAVDVPEGADQTKQPQSQAGKLSCVVDSTKQIEGIVQSQTETDAQIMKSNKDEIKALFSILLGKIQKEFESQKLDVSDVRRFLVNFFQKEDFLSATTFDDIFCAMTVNHLWDYQNYSPLEKLTNHLLSNNPAVTSLISNYKASLTGYFVITKLPSYMKYRQLVPDDFEEDAEQPPTRKKLTKREHRKIMIALKLDRRISDVSLDYVHNLWRSFAEEYDLPSATAIIEDITLGSLRITWLLLPFIISKITPRSKFFKRNNITQILIDDVIFYDEKEMAGHERKMLDLCQDGKADATQVSHLLQTGVDPDVHDENGNHPLWYASYYGRTDLVELLLIKSRANVNLPTKDEFGDTALIAAVDQGHLSTAALLLDHGADVNKQNKKGWSPLWKASRNKKDELVLLLLEHKAEIDLPSDNEFGDTALFAASQEGHLTTAALLLDHGADVNKQRKEGITPLYFASKNGHTELVELLLKRGARVNQGTVPPLYTASRNGRVDIVKRLIRHGADVNLPTQDDEFGSTPLGMTCYHNHPKVVTVLIENGAVVDSTDKKGMSALHFASYVGNTDVVNLLLKYHAQLEIKNNEGRTALMIASWRGHLKIVKVLLGAGAETDVQDQEGLTSLMLATKNGHTDVVKALLKAKADPNLREKNSGWSALFFSSQEGHLKITKLLISAGAVVDRKDKDDATAYVIAEVNGHSDLYKELEKHSRLKKEGKAKVSEEQKTQLKRSYQRLLKIFGLLEDTLLKNRKEKKLQDTSKKVHQTSEENVPSLTV